MFEKFLTDPYFKAAYPAVNAGRPKVKANRLVTTKTFRETSVDILESVTIRGETIEICCLDPSDYAYGHAPNPASAVAILLPFAEYKKLVEYRDRVEKVLAGTR